MLKRFLGAGLGWAFGGPIGGILGWWIAGKFDKPTGSSRFFFNRNTNNQSTSSDFMVATLILASEVIKADNKIQKAEIEFVRTFLQRYFPISAVQEMMMFLNKIQNKGYSLNEVCGQINQNMNLEEKIHILHFLFSISKSDNEIHPKEIAVINQIALQLQIPAQVLHSIRAMYTQQGSTIQKAYAILGLKENDNIEMIKKRFRDLSLKYHPDRVTHLGEEIKKNAEEKFKEISEAYETIRREKKI